jgi:hypothetical protein
MLLAAGAAVDRENNLGETALFAAAGGGHDEVVRALLAAGADINHRRRDGGSTALRLAAERGHTGTVQLLIKAGAKTDDEL